jgi:RNA polymerase sigma factor (sigma-70 family)
MGKGMNEWRTDFELLREFTRHGDQESFARVVRRHIDLVYATALRKIEDQSGAEEIAQDVFATLARKSWQFAPDDSLPAWLYRTTLLEAQEWLRAELRRRRREQTAAQLGTTMKTSHEQTAFRALLPLLDEALLSLREKDRTALLLRFYENQSLRDVGAAFGIGEDAAQKRVAAAVTKLARFFRRRGFKTATVATAAAALQHTAASASASTVNVVLNAAIQAGPPSLTGVWSLLARVLGLSKMQKAALGLVLLTAPCVWYGHTARPAQHGWTPRETEPVATAPQKRRSPPLERMIIRHEDVGPGPEPSLSGPAGRPQPKDLDRIQLTGIINLPQYKAAVLEIRFYVLVRSNAVVRTNHLILKEGQSGEELTFKGTNLSFELLQIDPEGGSVTARENGREAEFALAGQDAVRAGPGGGAGSRLTIRLCGASLAAFLDLYGGFLGRTILCHPAVKWSPLDFRTTAADQVTAARELERVLRERGLTALPDGDRFEWIVPTRLARLIHKPASAIPSLETTGQDIIPPGGIRFENVALPQAMTVYAVLTGRRWLRRGDLSGNPISLRNQTPLTRAQAVYALDTLLGWQDLKIVPVDDRAFRVVRFRNK